MRRARTDRPPWRRPRWRGLSIRIGRGRRSIATPVPWRLSCPRLLRAAAARDVPDRFHLLPTHRVDAVVQIDGRVAVRREELDELAERGQSPVFGHHETAVLVARP